MKKALVLVSLLAMACLVLGAGAWAQGDDAEEFTLEEITVTAEKRAATIQQVPSSVVAIHGEDLVTRGTISTEEILDSIPNVTFLDGSGNTEGNIAVRGVQRPQVAAGGPGLEAVLPSATSVYVDGIYLGLGGEYDIDRVEVLRGPQGTLYGRSATGGVISFYTRDPLMGEYGGNASVEVGTDALVNVKGALNVPIGEKVALRASARYYTRDNYFAEDSATGSEEMKEARLKARFQPTDRLDIVVQAATRERTTWTGGWSQVLDGPNDFNYKQADSYNAPEKGSPEESDQYGLNANYDFGDFTLTWIAGYHDYTNALNPPTRSVDAYGNDVAGVAGSFFSVDEYMTQEVRLASDDSWDSFFSWIVGANYFENEFVSTLWNQTTEVYAVSQEAYDGGVRVGQGPINKVWIDSAGTVENYGIFTEETFDITDAFRITAGLRYDKTEIENSMTFREGINQLGGDAGGRLPFLDPDGSYPYDEVTVEGLITEWDNVTYKLRFEYDLTADNMVYFTASTGFLPGFAGVTVGKGGAWQINVYDEQEMTAYEIGSKNEFMNNRLRLNGSVFYYDLDGYTDTFGLNDTGAGSPGWTPVTLDKVEIFGLDLDGEFLMTANDKLTFSIGFLNTEITPPETVYWQSGAETPGSYLLMIDEQTGHPSMEATLGYDHTFSLPDGATLVPRVELHYTGEHYLDNYTGAQALSLGDVEPYLKQDGYTLVNANITWTGPSQNYSVTGWVRNAFDEEFKKSVSLPNDPPLVGYTGVTPGDPRRFGLVLNVKF